jgi:predicted enzyme related to lactoylglutathione lyase
MKIEDIGRMAVMADPQGAVFAIFERRVGITQLWT